MTHIKLEAECSVGDATGFGLVYPTEADANDAELELDGVAGASMLGMCLAALLIGSAIIAIMSMMGAGLLVSIVVGWIASQIALFLLAVRRYLGSVRWEREEAAEREAQAKLRMTEEQEKREAQADLLFRWAEEQQERDARARGEHISGKKTSMQALARPAG